MAEWVKSSFSGLSVCLDSFLLSATTPDCIRGHPFFFMSRTALGAVSADRETTGANALWLIGNQPTANGTGTFLFILFEHLVVRDFHLWGMGDDLYNLM